MEDRRFICDLKSHRMIQFLVNRYPDSKSIISLYEKAQLIRPVADEERIAKMFVHSNLIISAWDGLRLVGLLRALTDQCYACYIPDVAVDPEYRGRGIGLKMLQLVSDHLGPEVTLITWGREKEDLWKRMGMLESTDCYSYPRMR